MLGLVHFSLLKSWKTQLSHFFLFVKYIFPNLHRMNLFHSMSRFLGTAVLTNQSACSQLYKRNCKQYHIVQLMDQSTQFSGH